MSIDKNGDGVLPVGHYSLDGRQYYGMNEFEIRAAAREAWLGQQRKDIRLAMKLDAIRRSSPSDRPVPPGPAPLAQPDLFSG